MVINVKCSCCGNQFVFDNSDIPEGSKYEIECPTCHTLLTRKKFETKNDEVTQQVYTTCCICEKSLPKKWERHNAEPVRNDVCCSECNNDLVKRARRVFWRLDEREYRKLLPHIQQMPIEDIESLLACEKPLDEIRKRIE